MNCIQLLLQKGPADAGAIPPSTASRQGVCRKHTQRSRFLLPISFAVSLKHLLLAEPNTVPARGQHGFGVPPFLASQIQKHKFGTKKKKSLTDTHSL